MLYLEQYGGEDDVWIGKTLYRGCPAIGGLVWSKGLSVPGPGGLYFPAKQSPAMENLVSNRSNLRIFPEDYIFPPDQRPGNTIIPLCNTVPVIDLSKVEGDDRMHVITEILKASQDFGFFQVINHGILKTLIDGTMDLCNEFFDMPNEDKARYYSEDPRRSCRLYTSSYNYANESVHFWRDNLTHPCHPLEQYKQLWPEKPTRYRELMGRYSVEVRKLSLRILDLIAEGLGLEQGYFEEDLSKEQILSVNHYPSCPDPSLSLGLPRHGDPNLVTILQQGNVYGLQVFKDDQWIGIEPIANAFVVNIGYQLQQWEAKKRGTQSSDER